MARTPSTMLPLGTVAPTFRLPDTEGHFVSLEDFKGTKGFLVMFISNHCPFVKHVRSQLAAIGREYQSKSLGIVAINSNDVVSYPDDSPANMKIERKDAGYIFPYLFDESQAVAKAYKAACTPDFYLFDANRKLVYRGQLDDSRPGNDKPVDGKDLRNAIEQTLAGIFVDAEQNASLGCNIKWKSGNEPTYYGAPK